MDFAENIHFQNFVEILCPACAKFGNAYLGANFSKTICIVHVFALSHWRVMHYFIFVISYSIGLSQQIYIENYYCNLLTFEGLKIISTIGLDEEFDLVKRPQNNILTTNPLRY